MAVSRTQAQRSEVTRGALAEAAIELLVERGWAATTAVAVCDRAGVTRGALLHHYNGLPDLLAAALQRLYDTFAADREAPTSLVGIIDSMWAIGRRPTFKAVIEAWLAAGNDPELSRALGPVIADFAKLVHPDERLPHLASTSAAQREHAISFVLTAGETLLGLALGRATTGGAALPHEARVLGQLRAQAAAIDATTTASD